MKFSAEKKASSQVGRHVLFEVRQEREDGDEDGQALACTVRVSDTGVRATIPETAHRLQVWADDETWSRNAEADEALALVIGEAAIRFKLALDSAPPAEES
jgi:hypothetical protein